MPKQIIIAEQHRIAAVFSEDQIQELIVATGQHQIGDIYLGIVENVLPGIDAAFVNIGDSDRNGFMHVTDLGPLRLKRSAGSITELLTPQQKVLVQVMKEPTGNKGPRLTGNITLPGRYLVLMPYGRGVNLSRRIRNENERNRLRALAILVKPAGMGLLVRTEAEGMAEEAIIEDLENLQKQWESIQQETASTRAPALLNRDDDFIQRVLRDMYSVDVNRIVVDSHTGLKRVKQQLINWSGGKSPQGVFIDHHRDRAPILEYFRVNAAIREALKPRVDLPSGGYIIIEPTEALTVIDVNSGSFTRSATARETVLWTNCEAAAEIARQLRLRNIAGVIIVDFIDMDSHRDKLQVLEHFNKALKADKARPQIAQLSELGLVELTRKRQGQNIYELFGRSCPTCSGLGHITHLPGEVVSHEPEPLERSGTAYYREEVASESRPRSRTPVLAETAPAKEPVWDEDLDLDGMGDSGELDLLNHPSYQERGNANNRRRRRRRVGTDSPKPIVQERRGREFPPAEASPSREPVLPKAADPVKEVVNAKVVLPEPENGLAAEESFTPPAKEGWTDRTERTKPLKREISKPAPQPPEVIAVEMTPEEQEVYALMGISPAVLVERDPKDLKSATLLVVLPGQAPPQPSIEAQAAAPSEARVELDSEQVVSQQTEPELPPAVSLKVEAPEPDSSSTPTPVEEVPVERSTVATAAPETPGAIAAETNPDESTTNGSGTRRRRRRSSATEASGSDAASTEDAS